MRWKDSKETGSSGSFKKEAGWRQSRGGRKTFHALITPLESLSYLFTKYTTVEWKRKSSIQMCSRTYKAIRPSVVNDRKCRGDTYVCQSGTRHISDGSNQFSLTRTDFGDKWKNRKVQDSVIECYHLSFWKKKNHPFKKYQLSAGHCSRCDDSVGGYGAALTALTLSLLLTDRLDSCTRKWWQRRFPLGPGLEPGVSGGRKPDPSLDTLLFL